MSLIDDHLDHVVVKFLFTQEAKADGQTLNRIYRVFRSLPLFLAKCHHHFFELLFKKYECYDIDDLIARILHKKSIRNFPAHRSFTSFEPQKTFTNMNAHNRLVTYYLSWYHGYFYIITNVQSHECVGSSYDNVWRNYDQPKTYAELKRKRVHNLDYYDCVEKKATLEESLFKPKPGLVLTKKGVTKENKDLWCCRVLTF